MTAMLSPTIADEVPAQLSAAGVSRVVPWAGSMFSIFFRDAPVRSYDDVKAQSSQAFTAFFPSMSSQGVHLPPSASEAWFVSAVSAAYDDEALDTVSRAPGGGPGRRASV